MQTRRLSSLLGGSFNPAHLHSYPRISSLRYSPPQPSLRTIRGATARIGLHGVNRLEGPQKKNQSTQFEEQKLVQRKQIEEEKVRAQPPFYMQQ